MGELERDVSCTKERNPPGQLVEFKESSAGGQVLLAGNAEVSRLGSRGDHVVPRLENLAIYRQPLRTHEPRGPVIGRDPSFLERLRPIGWHGIRKVRLNCISSGQEICASPLTPLPCIRRFQSARSAAPTRTFFGSQPRRAHVPP